MADSLRQDIIDALKTLLATITTGNGYETSIGSSVKEWYTADADSSVMPVINLNDESVEIRMGSDDLGAIQLRRERHEMDLRLEIRLTNGTTTATVLRKAIADVYKAIGTDRTLGGLAKDIRARTDRMAIEQQDKIIGVANINISIFYELDILNPYTS